MSMNLYLYVDDNKIDLWQTPTQITYMCMTQNNGDVAYELKGKKAKHSVEIYKQWIKYSTNGCWPSEEDLLYAEERAKNHLLEINQAMFNGRKIKTVIM